MSIRSDANHQDWRNAWIEDTWNRDISSVTQWFCLTVQVEVSDGIEVLLRRVLGWDQSSPPIWISTSTHGRVSTHVEPLNVAEFGDVLDDETRRGILRSEQEIRRVELPVVDWYRVTSAEDWGLRVPTIMYEMWSSREANARARQVWASLTDEERDASGISAAVSGYLASTIVLVPQVRPYFVRHGDFVIPGGATQMGKLCLVSEVRDGSVILARTIGTLEPEPFKELELQERSKYLRLHYPRAALADLHAVSFDGNADGLAAYPREAHGKSGSDWRITVVGIEGQICDTVEVGLIRGIGDRYFTLEPWKDRAPTLGFSAPARVIHVPPSGDAADAAFDHLGRAGEPAAVCDPYAQTASLEKFKNTLRGGRLLTMKNRTKNPEKNEETIEDIKTWARDNDVTVRLAEEMLHDRFVIGPRRAFLVGTSLNGLGKKHAFIIELDTVMQHEVAHAFEVLWSSAHPA